MAPRRSPQRRTTASRIASLEKRVTELEERVERMQGSGGRVLRAGPGDGRARSVTPPGPHCPGCRLHVDPGVEKCPWCGFVFAAIPARQRPGGKDNPVPKASAPRRGQR